MAQQVNLHSTHVILSLSAWYLWLFCNQQNHSSDRSSVDTDMFFSGHPTSTAFQSHSHTASDMILTLWQPLSQLCQLFIYIMHSWCHRTSCPHRSVTKATYWISKQLDCRINFHCTRDIPPRHPDPAGIDSVTSSWKGTHAWIVFHWALRGWKIEMQINC